MNDAQKALKELYDLIIEYDLNTQLEDFSQEYDRAQGDHSQAEYARVLGILEGVKLALDIDAHEEPGKAAGQKELL